MNRSYAFEYVTVRAVPRVDRGEFVNVGVIVYCQALRYVRARVEVDATRLRALDPDADVAEIVEAAEAYVAPCSTGDDDLTVPSAPGDRFRWLAAPRSTVIQPGPVHPGLSDDPDAELDRLFSRLVR